MEDLYIHGITDIRIKNDEDINCNNKAFIIKIEGLSELTQALNNISESIKNIKTKIISTNLKFVK